VVSKTVGSAYRTFLLFFHKQRRSCWRQHCWARLHSRTESVFSGLQSPATKKVRF